MSFWKIQWFVNGSNGNKKKLYEDEKIFERYWKYHAEYIDYINGITDRNYVYGMIAYKDGVEIRRCGKF